MAVLQGEGLEDEGTVEWTNEAGVAEMLRRCREGLSPVPSTVDAKAKYSLPGMQPKAALYREAAVNGHRWGVPQGGTPTTHILKPPIPGLAGQVENRANPGGFNSATFASRSDRRLHRYRNKVASTASGATPST